ncbi:protein GPR107-like [Actinia tenebrosa]|uniref:Protein GPR107-like n=1 Tax=Actinia tenebrosa TaxID=6105 RepID=A0A6P8ITC9_ACTTE|nr:protein GPR107-like [Actinia tenebrosa]
MASNKIGKFRSLFILSFLLLFINSTGRKHHLTLKDEARKSFELSKFGFLKNGFLKVEVRKIVFKSARKGTEVDQAFLSRKFGFSLEKTASDGISPYMEQHAGECILKDQTNLQNRMSVAVFIFDLKKKSIIVQRFGPDFNKLEIGFMPPEEPTTTNEKNGNDESAKEKTHNEKETEEGNETKEKKINKNGTEVIATSTPTTGLKSTSKSSASTPLTQAANLTPAKKENDAQSRIRRDEKSKKLEFNTTYLPLSSRTMNETIEYSGNFTVTVKDKNEEGLYNLYFHNCANYGEKTEVMVDIQVKIVEKNAKNYLSAGEEPLPHLFSVMAAVFFLTACFWIYVLRQNRENTFKVHYMMFVLIMLKAMDLAFESINYYYISSDGIPKGSWAVVYYITHLLKGALLFTTIVLIGTGYFFVKHVLSDRDKKIFIIVIPLQILANSAQIVMDTTEEARVQYATWKELFILVDLMCCGAILFPVVWSIRHLQEASKTDGKAAINLAKLKLFRHFYVMIVCYIYFTRIIVYLIKITVPFQYMWFDELFKNAATYIFFVLTGYNFRPFPDNPYLHVAQEDSDDEIEMDEVVTTNGLLDGVTRVQPVMKQRDTSESKTFSV